MSVDRRRHQRWQLARAPSFNFDGIATGTILNVGEGGVGATTHLPLSVGGTGVVSFDCLGTDTRFEGSGEVLWRDETGRTGIRFLDCPDTFRPKLASWLLQNAANGENDQPAGSAADVSLLRMFIACDTPENKRAGRRRDWLLGTWVLALIVVVGILWFHRHHSEDFAARAAAAPEPAVAVSSESLIQKETPNAVPDATATGKKVSATKRDSGPLITRITYWSEGNSTYVAIQLQAAVKFEAHRLHHPERIYVDMHGVELAPALQTESLQTTNPTLLRIRLGHPKPGLTRVVLETGKALDYRATLIRDPYRLVIAIEGTRG